MDKKYFNIDEISKLINEKKHTIRFWEDKIPHLNVLRTHAGRRLYNYENLLILKKIKSLINNEKITLSGVAKYFENNNKNKRNVDKDLFVSLKVILDLLKKSN